MRLIRAGVISSFFIVASGCHRHHHVYAPASVRWAWVDVEKGCTLDSPTYLPPPAAIDSLNNAGYLTNSEWSRRAALASRIPGGWGGITSVGDSPPVAAIYLVDTTQSQAALRALVAAGVKYASMNNRVIEGRWTYGQLYEWMRYINSHWRMRDVGWALDESRNQLYYDDIDSAAMQGFESRLAQLNVPCHLVVTAVQDRMGLQSRH
jgi:hypothetical protein